MAPYVLPPGDACVRESQSLDTGVCRWSQLDQIARLLRSTTVPVEGACNALHATPAPGIDQCGTTAVKGADTL